MPSHRFTFSDVRRWTEVHVGADLFAQLARDLSDRVPSPSSLFVLSDSNVAPLHGARLVQLLNDAGLPATLLTMPAGEEHKTRAGKDRLEDQLLELGADRGSLLINVGGGMVCDVGGFLAATWQRGIPTIHLPTSLLAMVDAALGGKTAVNLPRAKNMVGAFHQPIALYVDLETLATLPDEEYRQGLAEVVKSAAIADRSLFELLEAEAPKLLTRDPDLLATVVDRCLCIKGAIVAEDERESGRRAALNFGHTVAHALEIVSDHILTHGDAVALGMRVEARCAAVDGGLAGGDANRIDGLLDALGFADSFPIDFSLDEVLALAARDKKSRSGDLVIVVPQSLGEMPELPQLLRVVGEGQLRQALTAYQPSTRN
ncbi:MAG: 3-dehydroquinate synthase [Acidobacteriota bacterium]|nr:3-dehydroquinate synthase [Acidobacteriota bacterium]MDH3786207.1 3-dehydroquinate synthase [Acidobacteriota bacterium]